MTILIIGNSRHLSEAISLAFPDDEIKVMPWRGLADQSAQIRCDLLFVVGFDYGSYMKRYEDYMDANVVQPMLAVERFVKPSADIVYVATQDAPQNFTFSRYRYAKEMLGHALTRQFFNSYVLRFDTFATSTHDPLVKGGAITRLIFSCLVRLGLVKTVDMLTVRDRLKAYRKFATQDLREIKGILIFVARPQFADRLMRLLFA